MFRHDARTVARARTKKFAAYRSAGRARSRADFIHTLGNANEEVDEAALWLELLAEGGICPVSATGPLWQEADELTRIFVKSRETVRSRR